MKDLFNHSIPTKEDPVINITSLPSHALRSLQAGPLKEKEVKLEDTKDVVESDVVDETTKKED